ncbi:MAG: L-2-hydroxyglutarate oxidase, partial [Gemmatimonadota bacterium]
MHSDIAIIGGGIVGLATAWTLLQGDDEPDVRILEKEAAPATHQSAHNSGVLHAGLQYAPGSAKARLARDGIRRMTEFCRAYGIRHEICGKLVVATEPDELPRLDALLERGRQNGLQGLRRLEPAQAREIEPNVRCLAAIHVPEEGIVDFDAVCRTLDREVRARGGDVRTRARVRAIRHEPGGWRITTDAGDFSARILINCAGLHTDRVARLAGERPDCRILPFRGEYHRLRPGREHLVRNLIYPLPPPGFPFLGVHFTRRIDGGIDAGPNAVLAFAREGYSLTSLNPRDLAEALAFSGLRRFVLRHRRMVASELARSFSRHRFADALRRLVPDVRDDDLVRGGAGVRAQAVLPSGEFVHDFLWIERPDALHVLNAPSPAATAALA